MLYGAVHHPVKRASLRFIFKFKTFGYYAIERTVTWTGCDTTLVAGK